MSDNGRSSRHTNLTAQYREQLETMGAIVGVATECPPEMEELFLKQVLAHELEGEGPPLLEHLKRMDVDVLAPDDLDDSAIQVKLWEIIDSLARLRVYLHSSAAFSGSDLGSLITISGGNRVGVLSVNTGVTFTVENLTIANGRAPRGGGICNDGTLMVTNSTFSGSNANRGGGIVNQGTLTVTNSTFAGNAGGVGAGIVNEPSGTLTASHGFARSPDSHDIPTVEWMPPIVSPSSLGPLCVMIIPCTTGPGRISRSGRIRPNLGPGGPDSRGSDTL